MRIDPEVSPLNHVPFIAPLGVVSVEVSDDY